MTGIKIDLHVKIYIYFCFMLTYPFYFVLRNVEERARGSVVVKALCYKQEDRGFETR
jgi:hypothetical protein